MIGTDRTHARVMPLDHSCVLYTAVLWSLALTRQHSRARIPGTCAAALIRTHTDIADFASDSLCAEGEVATSSCVPSYCTSLIPSLLLPISLASGCVPVSEEVQGPLCGATCAGVTAYGGAWLWLRRVCPSKSAGGVESACCAPSPGGAGCSGRRSCRRCS